MNTKDYIKRLIVDVLTPVLFVLIIWFAIDYYEKKEDKELLNPIEFKYKGHDMVKFNNMVIHSPECRKCFPKYD